MDAAELIVRDLVRDTIARYAHCADSGRFEEMVQLFTEDGVMEIDGREPMRGRAAILSFLGSVKKSLAQGAANPYIRHHVSSVQIEIVSAAEASSASYFLAITEHGPDHWGRYRDRLVPVGERWLFAHRRVRIDGRRQF